MIGYFPAPYPDELFYSICARFSDRMRYPAKVSVARQLFGATTTAIVDFPGCLDYFISALPPGHCYTADTIIDNHTLLPFFGPFLPPERLQRLRAEMRRGRTRNNVARIGLASSSRPALVHLRYCPMCVERDRKKYGECYWHRIHQLPGIDVCPDHITFLEDSGVLRKNHVDRHTFFSAEDSIPGVSPRLLDLSNDWHKVFLHIARDSAWLLAQQNLDCGPKSVRSRYLYLLAKQGFASYRGGTVHIPELEMAFKSRYSPELLAQLDCEWDEGTQKTWLARLVRLSSGVQPPVKNLLLMHFLGYSVKEFFGFSVEKEQFGEAPWPCLNPVSAHYRQLVVRDCEIVVSNKGSRLTSPLTAP